MVVFHVNRSDAQTSGTRLSSAKRRLHVHFLAWLLLGFTIGIFISRTQKHVKSLQPLPTQLIASHGHLDATLWKQSMSHVAFHENRAKQRLAKLVRKYNRVCVVGCEYGAEVFQLAENGYEVYAFEPTSRFHGRLQSILEKRTKLNVHLYKVAASDKEGMLELQYMNGAPEKVRRGRIDDFVTGGLDVLSIDIQGPELDAVRGARQLMESTKVRSLWLEIFSCNPKVRTMLHLLDSYGYVIFDFVPWGNPRMTESNTSSLHELPNTAALGFNERPSDIDEYYKWFCAIRNKHFHWLQSDILAIRREIITPQMKHQLSALSNDLLVDAIERSKHGY